MQKLGFWVRPHTEKFLEKMSKSFDIVIFTASKKDYAELIVRILDPKDQYISSILSQEQCVRFKGAFKE